MRVLLAAAIVLVGIALILRACPTRERRLWDFVEGAQDALLDGRDADLVAAFDPAVRYRRTKGLKEIGYDVKRFHALGAKDARFAKREVTLTDEGADVHVEVVLWVGIRPVGQGSVWLHAVERDGEWKITELRWE